MATYKQRTPYQRHTATYSDEDDPHTLLASASSKQAATAAQSVNLTSQHHSHFTATSANNHHLAAEDDIVENTSDREWTSIRNHSSTASARAKVRQQQYLDQQQQRTREWQFVLAQHRHSQSQSHPHSQSFLASAPPIVVHKSDRENARDLSSDDYDELLSGTEAPSSLVTSPRVIDTLVRIAGTGNGHGSGGEHSSVFGFSDLTSDGLESVGGESEDLGVWSHEDEEDTLSLSLSLSVSTPAFRRLPSSSASPRAASSTTASLSHLQRPSFAASPSYNSNNNHGLAHAPKFQNQMPFHDGSGNFFAAGPESVRSTFESDIEIDIESEDHGWESSSSRTSSALRPHRFSRSNHAAQHRRRRISSSEFQAVIQNIADLQHTSPRLQPTTATRPRSLESEYSDTQPHFTYPNVVTKRPIFNIYESEMEDMAEMVMEVPAKISWMQAFEKALHALHPNEYDVQMSKTDSRMMHPIKALAQNLAPEDAGANSALEVSGNTANQVVVQQVQQSMAAASFETMKRLQTRKRSSPSHPPLHPRYHQRYASDPMHVDFSPTLRDHRSMFEDANAQQQRKDRRALSRSTGTSTTSNMRDTNLLAVVISTLRRFRDHVQSNLLYAEFLDEEEENRHADLAKSLGFDGDLGIEWAAGDGDGDGDGDGAAARRGEGGEMREDQDYRAAGSNSTTGERRDWRHERAPSVASSSRSSSHQNMRRVSSDCGLESMKQYKTREVHHPIHSPSLVG